MIEARGWKLLIFNRYENLLLTLVGSDFDKSLISLLYVINIIIHGHYVLPMSFSESRMQICHESLRASILTSTKIEL